MNAIELYRSCTDQNNHSRKGHDLKHAIFTLEARRGYQKLKNSEERPSDGKREHGISAFKQNTNDQ